jgi:AcrR family transcriptional regulator
MRKKIRTPSPVLSSVPFPGQADPETTLNLLWGSPPAAEAARRGPKRSLSATVIGTAALELADEGGLAALSMRALGARLGVAPMALYRYVPNKDVLLELVLEAAYAQLPDDLSPGADWQTCLRTVATDAWNLYRRHPWILQIALQRPSLGPHAIRKYERELRAIEGAGLTDLDMDLMVAVVSDYVRGSAHSATEATSAASQTGQSDAQWWAAHATHLERLLVPEQFPLAVRVGSAAGAAYGGPTDPARSFEFGLARLIDGLALHVAKERGGATGQWGAR